MHRVRSRLDAHALFVDLSASEISLVATRAADRGMPVRDFARKYDAEIAINANFFDGRSRSCGFAMGEGEVWRSAYEDGCHMSIGFGALNEAEVFESTRTLRGPAPFSWMTQAVSGMPWLVRDGVLQGGWSKPALIHSLQPRTAIGLSEDRRTLILLVVDGRRSGAPGMSGNGLATTMVEFGAYNALNLDGGGSSELFVRAEGGVQNHPSDGRGRGVGNHLGIRVRRVERQNIAAVTPSESAIPRAAEARTVSEQAPEERLPEISEDSSGTRVIGSEPDTDRARPVVEANAGISGGMALLSGPCVFLLWMGARAFAARSRKNVRRVEEKS